MMNRKLTGILAAFALAATSLVPLAAEARDRHGGYGQYDGRRDYRHDRHDNNDAAIAVGVIGLVLGLAIGAAASQPRQERARCYDNGQYCEAPQQGYGKPDGYDQGAYDPRYDDSRSAYEEDYGELRGGPAPYAQQSQCTRRERQWDRYANQYVTVDVPC